jgi:hypothetical protein
MKGYYRQGMNDLEAGCEISGQCPKHHRMMQCEVEDFLKRSILTYHTFKSYPSIPYQRRKVNLRTKVSDRTFSDNIRGVFRERLLISNQQCRNLE